MKKITSLFFFFLSFYQLQASFLLIPMDDSQKNHLKAYGIAYYALQNNLDVNWLLNYRGGSFMFSNSTVIQKECAIRGVTSQILADGQAASILTDISNPEVNRMLSN